MAIEPLGSIMSVQAQTAHKTVEAKPVVENRDVAALEQAAVDPVVQTVAKVDSKGNGKEAMDERTAEQQPNPDKIRKAVEELNKKMPHSEAVYGFHEDTNRVTIKIIDRDTKEVIKELPPEKTLDMIAKVWELAGIMVDEKR